MTTKTLYEWHMRHSLRVITVGTGRSYVVVPDGETLGGHLQTVLRLARVDGWQPIRREHARETLVPTYAYDRVVVAGLRLGLTAEALSDFPKANQPREQHHDPFPG